MGTDPFGWVGQRLGGRYRVDAFVGEGGFAAVYRGFHESLRVAVALKCLKLGSTVVGAKRETFLERFLLEGQLLHRLSRGNAAIAQALDVGVEVTPSGQVVPYLVLEWLEGRSLAADFEERARAGVGPRSLPEAIECLEPAAQALDYAHGQGIAHRDIKPDNLFLAFVGGSLTLKVLDFGIAKVVEDAAAATPGAGSVTLEGRPFTPGYAAPEQLNPNLGSTGPWTDVNSLALVLLETVSGRKAIQGTSNLELHKRALDPEQRPSFAALGVAVPDAVESVVARALAVDPRNRYRRAGELWQSLRAAISQGPSVHARTTPSHASPVTQTETAFAPSSATEDTHDTLEEPRPASLPEQTLGSELPLRQSPRRHTFSWKDVVVATALAAMASSGVLGSRACRDEETPPAPSGPSPTLAASQANAAPVAVPTKGVLVERGRFRMGPDSNPRNAPQTRLVDVASFRIGATEVSVGEYQRYVDAVGRDPLDLDGECGEVNGRAGMPVVCVSWHEAHRYCEWDHGWLPTDAEWEFAARGEAQRTYPWGPEFPDCTRADFTPTGQSADSCRGRGPSPGGSFLSGATPLSRVTPFRIYDLAGNVWEWVQGPYGDGRQVMRGGTWGSPAKELQATWRRPMDPGAHLPGVGFRCAYPVASPSP